MRIMVFDVPAESGGALSVLTDFYNLVKDDYRKNIEWIFVVSTPHFSESSQIKVFRYPWIKKSWFHRLYFDNFISHKLVKKYNVDMIFSLQNIIVPHTNTKQIIYVHNSLPFIEHKFSIFQNSLLWIYQNIIGYIIKKSIKKSDYVIAQANWMKNEFTSKIGVSAEKIFVISPQINLEVKQGFEMNQIEQCVNFFYPASAVEFKNHKVIIDACKLLSVTEQCYQVILTVTGDENRNIKSLKKEATEFNLNIKFIGQISREEVFQMYSKSVLLFPSYVESSPLPLTEAALHNCIIVASDCAFSREILNGFNNAYLFDPFNPNDLLKIMLNLIKNEIPHNKSENFNTLDKNFNLNLIDLVLNIWQNEGNR